MGGINRQSLRSLGRLPGKNLSHLLEARKLSVFSTELPRLWSKIHTAPKFTEIYTDRGESTRSTLKKRKKKKKTHFPVLNWA